MKNLVFLIGRLTEEPIVKVSENNRNHCVITLAVQRDFKNSEGVYVSDFIRCSLWNAVATKVSEYCNKGDLIGVKGRIQNRSYVENEETKYITEIIADKVSFLSSRKTEEE